jgi:glutamate synthase domain-containing protein 1
LSSHCSRAPQLFILRKFIESELAGIGMGEDDVYFCSLSSATVVYKGQLTPEQVRPAARQSGPWHCSSSSCY